MIILILRYCLLLYILKGQDDTHYYPKEQKNCIYHIINPDLN